MASKVAQKRGKWSQEHLARAVEAVTTKKMSDYKAAEAFQIPRRTLRRYVQSGSTVKAKLGRKFALSDEQNSELCARIVRLAEIGYPITTKILRLCVYKYCKQNNLNHQFSDVKQIASHKWVRSFLKANPNVSIRKSQNLNPARAQKLNKFIVDDHFAKIKQVFEETDIFGKPERLFNMDEKGCRLNLHKEPKVLAKKGARRVHIIGNEHGENVTIVSCANALGVAIPPMVLFKGKRMKQEFSDDLPPRSVCRMTEKGSMTSKCFVDWLHHFGKFKSPGRCVLIFDGAKSHLDYEIVETADQYDVVLYCLPSNTTHELQPLDKAVFRSFEYHWDQQLMLYWHSHGDRTLTKQRFGKIFSRVWDQSMTPSNIKSGFKATGLFPYDPSAIPEEAFLPSTASNINVPESVEPLPASTPTNSLDPGRTSPQPGPSGLSRSNNIAALDQRTDVDSSDSSDGDENTELNTTFSSLLPTPEKRTPKINKRQKAINSRAVVLKKDIFSKENQQKNPKTKGSEDLKKPPLKTLKLDVKKKSLKPKNESWYCPLCQKDEVKDMRLCLVCSTYVHEECVGLTKNDTEKFVCPMCSK